jgi:hypothetical protein
LAWHFWTVLGIYVKTMMDNESAMVSIPFYCAENSVLSG